MQLEKQDCQSHIAKENKCIGATSVIKRVHFTVYPLDSSITLTCLFTFRVNAHIILFLSFLMKLRWSSVLYSQQHDTSPANIYLYKNHFSHQPPNLSSQPKLLGRSLPVSLPTYIYICVSQQSSKRSHYSSECLECPACYTKQ